jgi:Flp pilus assembly protein TadG
MSAGRLIRRDERGVAAIEMAFALPILMLFVYGIFQVGVILQANAGMQHALGEGARMATIYPSPADDAIEAKMSDAVFGMNIGTFGRPTVTTPEEDDCTYCKDLQVTYSVTPDFLFFNGPPIRLSKTKRVYQAHPRTT